VILSCSVCSLPPSLLYFVNEILRFDIVNLRNPSNFKFRTLDMKRVIPSGLHACDQILDGENGRWWSPKSIGKIKHIFLPLLLLYRKIHFFSRSESKERCVHEQITMVFERAERVQQACGPLFLLALFSRYISSPVANRVIKLTLTLIEGMGSPTLES